MVGYPRANHVGEDARDLIGVHEAAGAGPAGVHRWCIELG